jgi:valyl-tRNA synthetase
MDKNYNHFSEKEIYALWEKRCLFNPDSFPSKKKPFSIIMPPPNANDPLHVGHARFVTISDILIRYFRMKGYKTLWVPGADHAGIETQFVFEKKLREKGESRFDFTREELYQMIWNYVQENKALMIEQLKLLGSSCDWSRFKFTLDQDIINVVYSTFKKLYDAGLVYRGKKIINYCPRCGTSFSQLEVDYVEREDFLYYLDYETIHIATTRPETIFADVAVAVNPNDKRYKNLIGQYATIPIIKRKIPIIADRLVDPKFGTGALKITPAHDPVDFEIGLRHNLTPISVIDENGKIINSPEKYIGLNTTVAREEIVKDLDHFIVKTEKISHTVGTCYRDKGIIEPTLSDQWFIKVSPLVKLSLDAIKEKKVVFVHKRFERMAKHWYKNLKDWNISRQIVWGIRIPAFRCNSCTYWNITSGEIPDKCQYCGHTKLTQDPDTFDTWFSSGMWPFATLMTTRKDDFKTFYPTSVMVTAYDILPFWVIRMIMLGIFATGNIPFEKVLLYGLVRDKFGQKISKSKGNVINPIEMLEKYGADSVRNSLVWGTLIENDISLSEDNIRGQRNFANKIWNIARFIKISFSNYPGLVPKEPSKIRKRLNDEDRNILKKLQLTVKSVSNNIEKCKLSQAISCIYDFAWKDLADKYLEGNKSREDKDTFLCVLRFCFTNCIKILHPFMPFITESVWQQIKEISIDDSDTLAGSAWPTNRNL